MHKFTNCRKCGETNLASDDRCLFCRALLKEPKRESDIKVSVVPMSKDGTYVYPADGEFPRHSLGKIYLTPDGALIVK